VLYLHTPEAYKFGVKKTPPCLPVGRQERGLFVPYRRFSVRWTHPLKADKFIWSIIMKVIKVLTLAFALGCIVRAEPAWAIEVTPSNVVLPASTGGLFSFDLAISSTPPDINASGLQCTIDVSPAGLTFDADSSEAVTNNPGYWIYGNSIGAFAEIRDVNKYRFSDGPSSPPAEILHTGDIMARYAFIWDGIASDYTFALDLDIKESFVLLLNGSIISKEALEFNRGSYRGNSNSFTVTIPEPTIVCLLSLGALGLIRRKG
jgi:hypothetical protein